MENDQIIGHAIWHESSSKEHKPGDKRDSEDLRILEQLLGGEKEFVELHELWLTQEHRGKGYGKKFFDFFEELMRKEGHEDTIFYAYNSAALTICRKRGYKEIEGFVATGIEENWEEMSIFHKDLNVKNSLY